MRLLLGAIRGSANFHRQRIIKSYRSTACSTCLPMMRTWLTASHFHIRTRTWRSLFGTWISSASWSLTDPWNPSVTEDWVISPPSISYMCYWMNSESWRVRRPCRIEISITSERSVCKQYEFVWDSMICKIYCKINICCKVKNRMMQFQSRKLTTYVLLYDQFHRSILTYTRLHAWIKSICLDSSKKHWRITPTKWWLVPKTVRPWHSAKSFSQWIWRPMIWASTCWTCMQ